VDREFLEKERREFMRMEIPLAVRLSIMDSEEITGRNIEKNGEVCNISLSGACLELDPPSHDPLTKGDDSLFEFKNKMEMEIELFEEVEKIKVKAVSHWYHIKTRDGKRRLYVGVSFTHMCQDDHNALELFLSSIEKGLFFMKNCEEMLTV